LSASDTSVSLALGRGFSSLTQTVFTLDETRTMSEEAFLVSDSGSKIPSGPIDRLC